MAWGDNSRGQTEVPPVAGHLIAIAAGRTHSVALQADGRVLAWGSGLGTYTARRATNAVTIAAGDDFSLALGADGTVIGTSATLSGMVALAAGQGHWLGVRTNGTVLAGGQTFLDQTAVPINLAPAVMVAGGGDHSLALQSDSRLVAWVANYREQCAVPAKLTNVVALAAGGAHNLALVTTATHRPTPPPISPISLEVTLGEPARFTGAALAGSRATYQWFFNGRLLPDQTGAALYLSFVHWTNAGVFRLVASNALGTVWETPVSLHVQCTPLRFDPTSPRWLAPGGEFHARLLGAAGLETVEVLASSDLVSWQPVFSHPPVIGTLEFTDAEVATHPVRFYRAREVEVSQPVRIDLLAAPRAGRCGWPIGACHRAVRFRAGDSVCFDQFDRLGGHPHESAHGRTVGLC